AGRSARLEGMGSTPEEIAANQPTPQPDQNPLQQFGQQLTDSIVGMVKHLTGGTPATDTTPPIGPQELSGPEKFVRSIENPNTGNPIADVAGTAVSALGTAANAGSQALNAT